MYFMLNPQAARAHAHTHTHITARADYRTHLFLFDGFKQEVPLAVGQRCVLHSVFVIIY